MAYSTWRRGSQSPRQRKCPHSGARRGEAAAPPLIFFSWLARGMRIWWWWKSHHCYNPSPHSTFPPRMHKGELLIWSRQKLLIPHFMEIYDIQISTKRFQLKIDRYEPWTMYSLSDPLKVISWGVGWRWRPSFPFWIWLLRAWVLDFVLGLGLINIFFTFLSDHRV